MQYARPCDASKITNRPPVRSEDWSCECPDAGANAWQRWRGLRAMGQDGLRWAKMGQKDWNLKLKKNRFNYKWTIQFGWILTYLSLFTIQKMEFFTIKPSTKDWKAGI